MNKTFFIIAIVLLVVALVWSRMVPTRAEREIKHLNVKYDSLQSEKDLLSLQLKRSDIIRDSLIHRLDSSSLIIKDLRVGDSLKTVELDKVKGSFDKFSNKELEAEMIKRYEQSHH